MLNDDHIIRAALADAAVLCQPRLFAVHGLHKHRERGTILGWGIQFPDNQGTFYTDPTTCRTRSTSTAENLLMHLRVVGDVDLTWLTHDSQETE